MAKTKSFTSESKASVIDMQAVGVLDGPQYERRRAAHIDRPPARGERPSAANGDMVTVVTKKIFAIEESCVPSEAEDRLTVEALPPIRRRNCACRVRRGWQEVRSVRCHSCQRCNICAIFSE